MDDEVVGEGGGEENYFVVEIQISSFGTTTPAGFLVADF